jgi:hypothetical protein
MLYNSSSRPSQCTAVGIRFDWLEIAIRLSADELMATVQTPDRRIVGESFAYFCWRGQNGSVRRVTHARRKDLTIETYVPYARPSYQ